MPDGPDRRGNRRRLAALVLASLAAVLVVGVGSQLLTNAPIPEPSAGPPEAIVRPGDTVVAFGTVVVLPDGDVVLCGSGGSLARAGAAQACGASDVPLLGVDADAIPGLELIGPNRVAQEITVRGTWTADGLAVSGVAPGGQPIDPWNPANPCPGQSGMQPDAMPLDYEAAGARLQELVEAAPARFGGLWLADGEDGSSVLVLGVVGPPRAVRAEIAEVFPFPLCLVSVARSMEVLRRSQAALQAINPGWSVSTEYSINRVFVLVPVLTEAVWTEMSGFREVVAVGSVVHRP